MKKMPIIFIGHGSPMNAIENNRYSESWKALGNNIPKPRAILMLSAHWITPGSIQISTSDHPSMIYDMGGFPDELYRVEYPARGSQSIAKEIKEHIENTTSLKIEEHPTRGFDHGSWSVLLHIFPQADIPVISMSIDYNASPESLFNLGASLASLREQGILIAGSGNTVHNLMMIDWSNKIQYPWAIEFDKKIETLVKNNDAPSLFGFEEWGNISKLAHPTYDHLLPIFPLMGATDSDDSVQFFTPDIVMGSLSMRSIIWNSSK